MQKSWMPGDGPFESWTDEHDSLYQPEKLEEPKETEWCNYYCGLDLGFSSDYSALSLIEVKETRSGKKLFFVKYLKQFPLRTPYIKVARALKTMDQRVKAIAEGKGKQASLTFVIDQVGVGQAVAEIISKELPLADIWGLYVTGGINTTWDYEYKIAKVPKGQLISALVAAFDDNRIFISSRSRELETIREQLQQFSVKVSDNGTDKYSANASFHDDLLFSLAAGVYFGNLWGSRELKIW